MNNTQNNTLLDDEIPAKFKDPETGAVRLEQMVKSYKELEKRLSNAPSVPKTADDYKVTCDHGLFASDTEINKRLHENGFTNDQVQFVYDLAAEVMVPMIVDMAGDFEADKEIEKLINHFGGADKWQEVARQLLAFGQKNLPADVLDTLSSSYDGVLALYRMMNNGEPSVAVKPEEKAANQEGMDLQSMMRDPKYWRDRDPSFIAKVTEGFQRLYTDK
ncbi:MAG: hypothetical protein HRT94_08380 [Alphaproteobacteria bacterium]|nr:hypothetical protein [Alphaproteobacteria bacterium]